MNPQNSTQAAGFDRFRWLTHCLAVVVVGSAAFAGTGDDALPPEQQQAILMQRFVVSATRIERNPWRYASVGIFEVLSRASEHDTDWWLNALRRGMWLENRVMVQEWLPDPEVPYTVIIDDTDLAQVPASQLHEMPVVLHAPDDPLAWDYLSDLTHLATVPVSSFDGDTLALNTNVNGIDTAGLNYASMSLERLARSEPALPQWLLTGILAQGFGVFREGFDLLLSLDPGESGRIVRAAGPGTLWVSTEETTRLLKLLKSDKHAAQVEVAPLAMLFGAEPREENAALWRSEASLFVRWGLLGPGRDDPILFKAFRELVRRSRSEPVTEKVFTECFGFGFAAMKGRLDAYLRLALAKPSSVAWTMPSDALPPVELKAATSDQIGRILGDWLRMKGIFLRETNPELSGEFLHAAGKILERAYREDNGLPPDVDVAHGGERVAAAPTNNGLGVATVMKPFVVSADRIRDPRLLAVYGMYERDVGVEGKARELLEAATRTGVSRPRAYAALAQLRYAEAMAKPQGADGKLSAQQAAAILDPLKTALRHGPTVDLFDMDVATWTNCEARPTAGEVEEMLRGSALFPRNTDLAYTAAVLCSQSGYPAQAAKLIDRGLVFTTHDVNREYFEQLRATLETAK
jgi:hypothetical protein